MSLEVDKTFIRRHEPVLNSGPVDAGVELFADPCLFNGQKISREVIHQLRTILRTAASDMRWILEHLVAAGDWVAMCGPQTCEFVPPPGARSRRVASRLTARTWTTTGSPTGKIVEVREVRDGLSLQEQFGIGAAPERPGNWRSSGRGASSTVDIAADHDELQVGGLFWLSGRLLPTPVGNTPVWHRTVFHTGWFHVKP